MFDKSLFYLDTSSGRLNIFTLALPILIENIMIFLQGTVNIAVLSIYSSTAAASASAAIGVINFIAMFFSLIATGASIVICANLGANNLKVAKENTFTAITACGALALISTPFLIIYSRKLMELMNLEGELMTDALAYFRVRVLFITVSALSSCFTALLRCYGFPKFTLYTGLITNTANLFLNVCVVYCAEHIKVSVATAVGATCVISQITGLICCILFFKKCRISLKAPENIKSFFAYCRKMLRIGIPSGFSGATFNLTQTITMSMVATLGSRALLLKTYCSNILSYAFLFSMSMGLANQIMIGRMYGAGEYERADRVNAQLIKITIPVNLVISLAIVFFGKTFMGMFTDNQSIIAAAAGIFLIDIIAEQARAVSQIYEYALKSVQDIVFSTVFVIISCVVNGVLLSYFFMFKCGFGVMGLWMGIAVDEAVRAVVSCLRWKWGKWKTNF